jgi:hypothetical protein
LPKIGSRTFHNDRFSPLSHGQNQKILHIRVPHNEKPRDTKNQPSEKKFLKGEPDRNKVFTSMIGHI